MSKGSVQVLKRGGEFARSARKTIVVTGSSRGGTSMIAVVLRGLGIHMGTGLNNNHEDIDFFQILNHGLQDTATFGALVDRRDQQFDVWGMKSPLFVDNPALIDLLPTFRNLILVVVFRNPLANALSYQMRDSASLSESVLSVYEKLGHFLRAVLKFDIDLVGVNYEAAARDPLAFTRDLAGCLGVLANPAAIERAVQSISGDGGGYMNLPGEGWSVTPLAPGAADAEPGTTVELHTDFQSVVHSQRSFVFLGDIFESRSHLVVYAPRQAASFGTGLWLLVQSVPGAILYKEAVRYNVYLDLDGTFSLGRSFLVEIISEASLPYMIKSERPVRRLALGLASDTDAGRQLPAARMTVLVPAG